jgi:hypothetical protein
VPWRPLSLTDLQAIVERDLTACSDEQRAFFRQIAIQPAKWHQSPWGDQAGGFWAVAVIDDRVLWYNDIEEGFNVSRFTKWGTIPKNEYSCNQDSLLEALRHLIA